MVGAGLHVAKVSVIQGWVLDRGADVSPICQISIPSTVISVHCRMEITPEAGVEPVDLLMPHRRMMVGGFKRRNDLSQFIILRFILRLCDQKIAGKRTLSNLDSPSW